MTNMVCPNDFGHFRACCHLLGEPEATAGLNFGDCFAYALAKATGEALLYKGQDFSKTDLKAAAA